MPKIRDLGISVIPATMRPAEIGGGAADFEYWAQKTGCPATDPKPGVPPGCQPTNDPQCNPSPPQCNGTPGDQCCPTATEGSCLPGISAPVKNTVALPDAAVVQLKQQLHGAINDQINTELLN